jgi:hypothetical protein
MCLVGCPALLEAETWGADAGDDLLLWADVRGTVEVLICDTGCARGYGGITGESS